PNVALVGYTNAGKSSVMNVFVEKFINNEDKKVFEKNMLFATLETYVRNIKLPDNRSFLLSDTVGFVGDLPHNLVKAFRSTLEEVCDADLLLHIVDISNPNYENHIKVTNETLRQIGAENIPSIYVFNKSDLIELDELSDDRILISAKNNIGIDELVESICKQIFADYINLKIEVPYIEAKMISYIMENEAIINFEYTENGVMFHIECSKVEYVKYKEFII
ncbi:MAG: HflX GTPase family protein, partial [Peptostreptococcaceae bacterium]